MNSVRITRRRVSVAVTTVLAVTLGAGALAVPATAAPTAAPSAAAAAGAEGAEGVTADVPVAFPQSAGLAAAGKTGFLTSPPWWESGYRWIRYADGSTTAFDATRVDSTGSDVVVSGDGEHEMNRSEIVKLHDMATGGAPVAIDLGALKLTYVKGVSRDSVLATATREDRSQEVRLVTRTGAAVTQKTITGIHAGAHGVESTPARDGSVLVSYYVWGDEAGPSKRYLSLVDLATASVVSTHETDSPVAANVTYGFSGFSATHLAWVARRDDVRHSVVVADRATGVETRMDLDDGWTLTGGLLGSWVTYAEPSTLEGDGLGGEAGPLIPLMAKSPDSAASIKLLDYTQRVQPGPDGTLLARGGTLDRGEGIYRIALGADGKPAAELVASTGEPTKLVYLGAQFPQTLDLDTDPLLKWQLSRNNANIDLRITHRRTGKTFTKSIWLYTESAGSSFLCSNNVVCVSWSTIADESQMGKDAHIGDYDWSFKATPQNGVGPAVEATGSFRAVKTSAPHDIKDNGTPDLLARDAQGVLWRTDTRYDATRKSLVADGRRVRVGGGWQAYDRIEAVGDIAVRGSADFVARDRDGVLWMYNGADTGYDVTFPPRKRIGGGWNTYTRFTGGSDLTGDGRADLVATDKAGVLWLYKSTGSLTSPFAARKRIGHGWGVYNQITATGNIGGGPAGDLVARDASGTLWLYLGRGDGTFAPRTRIGGGWNAYTDAVGIGDGNKDGRPDLYAYGPGGAAYFYPGTGNYKAPFGARTVSGALLGDGVSYNTVS
ncbi:FG-GAP repeat domain-containing protein [Streptomyces sp. NPDC059352]|uniref:FG-GAP repeat domain-containing protein n=1 Tax=Streptomyces sp. NPDC059352 TaxID=3346810 RepID=UPI0036C22F93